MVKFFFAFFLLFTHLLADDLLNIKIKSFIGEQQYSENKEYINIIFSPKSNYYVKNRIDDVKIIKTLKENGLLNLFFKKPQELHLNFITSGSPLFFLKVMGDTLRDIGYYRYVTTHSNLNASEFIWGISLTSEYATDPLILQKELLKRGCSIIGITRKSADKWDYSIDMTNSYLNVKKLYPNETIELKRSLYSHWVNISEIKHLKIRSSRRNSWYPYITYYDKSLHLLEVIKRDSRQRYINLEIPPQAIYIKISDLYTLKNLKDPLILSPKGSR
ncbi:MAG: hypothetical protein U9N02_04395 [Campylobacterota bacterium]|nr:hypothetical protein [Campylobacterota bacterium]